MSMKPYVGVGGTKQTPQNEPIPGSKQVPNSAGGFSYSVNDWVRLDRFLILGSEKGSYYASERKLTAENAESVVRLIKYEDGVKVVARVVEISESGRAPKNDPALFVLSLCMKNGDEKTKTAAKNAIPKVARIGTHLFSLFESVNGLGGWGRGTRNAFGKWYTTKNAKALAMQLIKYQQRNGVSHADLLRQTHVKAKDSVSKIMFQWALGHLGDDRKDVPLADAPISAATKTRLAEEGKTMIPVWTANPDAKRLFMDTTPSDEAIRLIWAFEQAKISTKAEQIVRLINEYGLPRECIPTNFLNDVSVWEALLDNQGHGMPLTAMIRNLAKMTAIGLLKPFNKSTDKVLGALTAENLHKALVHPMTVLIAERIYNQGHGEKGSLKWEPVQEIVKALNKAFYLSFKNVKPTGKSRLVALDVSGSMGGGNVAGSPLTPREASAAMALVTLNTEEKVHIVGFTSGHSNRHSRRSFQDGISPLKLHAGMTLNEATNYTDGLDFGGTDCALPMIYALEKGLDVEAFEVYTDSETWAGHIHPSQALVQYRQKRNIPAKLAVVGMVANEFSIADPNDAGMLDCVGFDTATPNILSEFFSG